MVGEGQYVEAGPVRVKGGSAYESQERFSVK